MVVLLYVPSYTLSIFTWFSKFKKNHVLPKIDTNSVFWRDRDTLSKKVNDFFKRISIQPFQIWALFGNLSSIVFKKYKSFLNMFFQRINDSKKGQKVFFNIPLCDFHSWYHSPCKWPLALTIACHPWKSQAFFWRLYL